MEDNPYGMLRFEGERCRRANPRPTNVIYSARFEGLLAASGRGARRAVGSSASCSRKKPPTSAVLVRHADRALLDDEDRGEAISRPEKLTGRDATSCWGDDEQFPEQATYTHPAGGFYVWGHFPMVDTRRCRGGGRARVGRPGKPTDGGTRPERMRSATTTRPDREGSGDRRC